MYGWSTNQLKEEMNYIKDVSYWGYFVFLSFEADRRVGSEAWMGMLSRHFESLIWERNVSPFLCDDAKGISIILQQASLGWLFLTGRGVMRPRAPAGCSVEALGWFCIKIPDTHNVCVWATG